MQLLTADVLHSLQEHIQAGDIFQLVLSQRFERYTRADPFEIYRSLAQIAYPHIAHCIWKIAQALRIYSQRAAG